MDHEEENSKTLRTEFARNSESIVVSSEEVKDVEEFAYLGAIVEKKGGGSEDIRNNAEGTRCIPEAMEGVGRGIGKRKESYDMPIQDFSLTGPATWL